MSTFNMIAALGASDMDSYTKLVREIMRDALGGDRRVSRIFANSGAEHARVVISTMLDAATSSVSIYGEEAALGVFDAELLRAVAQKPGVSIRFLMERADAYEQPTSALHFLKDLANSGAVQARHAASADPVGHFTVVDKKHLRLESDHESRKAIVAFGEDTLGSRADEVFQVMWDNSEPMLPA